MAWPEMTFRDWPHFLEFACDLCAHQPPRLAYLFRGQSDRLWHLRPSLIRHLRKEASSKEALSIEAHCVKEFRSQAFLHIPNSFLTRGLPLLEWLSMMQHHNCPTRLLDWTESPFVAAYFAAERDSDRDGAIWFFHVKDLRDRMNDRFGDVYEKREPHFSKYLRDPAAAPSLQPWFPPVLTERMVAQQGAFTFSPQILGDPETIINDALGPRMITPGVGVVYGKMIVPGGEKPRFLTMLRAMNVTAASLFPGADGLGRSIAELVRMAAHSPQDH